MKGQVLGMASRNKRPSTIEKKISLLFILFMCICLHELRCTPCMREPLQARFPETRNMSHYEPLCDSNLGPLKEQ